MIDVHQNATLSESFEGNRLCVIGNRCNKTYSAVVLATGLFAMYHFAKAVLVLVFRANEPINSKTGLPKFLSRRA